MVHRNLRSVGTGLVVRVCEFLHENYQLEYQGLRIKE